MSQIDDVDARSRDNKRRVEELEKENNALKARLAELSGPKCTNEECPDYDGEHPYHQNKIVLAHEEGQRKLRDDCKALSIEVEMLRKILRECAEVEQQSPNESPWTIHDFDSYGDLAKNERTRMAWNAAFTAITAPSQYTKWLENQATALEEVVKEVSILRDALTNIVKELKSEPLMDGSIRNVSIRDNKEMAKSILEAREILTSTSKLPK